MSYVTEEHLHLLQAFDNHLKWLVEGYNNQDKDSNLEFDTLFEFHTRKLQGLLQDLADYFGAHKQYVSREPDIQADSTGGKIDPNRSWYVSWSSSCRTRKSKVT